MGYNIKSILIKTSAALISTGGIIALFMHTRKVNLNTKDVGSNIERNAGLVTLVREYYDNGRLAHELLVKDLTGSGKLNEFVDRRYDADGGIEKEVRLRDFNNDTTPDEIYVEGQGWIKISDIPDISNSFSRSVLESHISHDGGYEPNVIQDSEGKIKRIIYDTKGTGCPERMLFFLYKPNGQPSVIIETIDLDGKTDFCKPEEFIKTTFSTDGMKSSAMRVYDRDHDYSPEEIYVQSPDGGWINVE